VHHPAAASSSAAGRRRPIGRHEGEARDYPKMVSVANAKIATEISPRFAGCGQNSVLAHWRAVVKLAGSQVGNILSGPNKAALDRGAAPAFFSDCEASLQGLRAPHCVLHRMNIKETTEGCLKMHLRRDDPPRAASSESENRTFRTNDDIPGSRDIAKEKLARQRRTSPTTDVGISVGAKAPFQRRARTLLTGGKVR